MQTQSRWGHLYREIADSDQITASAAFGCEKNPEALPEKALKAMSTPRRAGSCGAGNRGKRGLSLNVWLFVENEVQQRRVNLNAAFVPNVTVVFNKAQSAKFVHKETDTRSGRPDHLRERFLADFRDGELCRTNTPKEHAH
jgi:hypothetical protein